MRHKIKTDSFSRFSTYRKATINSIVRALLLHQKIITTQARAKSARVLAEKLIGLGKKNTLAAKRRAFAILCDHALVSRLFNDLASQFGKRNGGYTRIIPYRIRRGDNAKLVVLELTEKFETKKEVAKEDAKKTEAKPAEKAPSEPIKEKIKPKEKEEKVKEEPAKAKKEPVKEAPKEAPKESLPSEEAKPKPHAHPEEEHKHKKPEQKKPKKFFGGFKGFFKRERDSL